MSSGLVPSPLSGLYGMDATAGSVSPRLGLGAYQARVAQETDGVIMTPSMQRAFALLSSGCNDDPGPTGEDGGRAQ
ncbi:hypothetical protein P8C59_001497 [Phyllachora maydis]|uniref:Uncharacterized protein n=1 Tax=Phyllachora maydis TaxID=1825666 RepID=A0AAD9HYA0_9PEZI|nr:hypothetical protein P8C59_001497 [Phyllachora maydis]